MDEAEKSSIGCMEQMAFGGGGVTKKKLPNHRKPMDNNLVEFSDEQVNRIKSKYGFNETYPLNDKLDMVAMFSEK